MSIFFKNFFWENPSGGGPKETKRGGGGVVARRNASVWEGEIETINRFSKTLNGFYAK